MPAPAAPPPTTPAASARRDGGAVRREAERRTEREHDAPALRRGAPSNLVEAHRPALVPAHPPLVPAPPPRVPPVVRPVAPRDPEHAVADDTADESAGERVTPGAAAVPPPPPGSIGARIQRSSLPELYLAMTTPDRGEDGGLLVDDDTATLTKGQMRKADFMRELRAEVRRTAEEELARVGRSAAGCPYIEEMLGRYDGRTAAELERAIRRYAPEARYVRHARDYLRYVTNRLARGIRQWASTGRMPDDAPSDEIEALRRARGWVGAFAGLAGISPPPEPRKDSPGGARDKSPSAPQRKPLGPSPGRVDAGALVAQLGPGRPLDPTTRSRMETSFGHSFAAVRIHADDHAAGLASDLAARAFTIGPHVALGAGAPAAGTIEGDALLAHELAHVVQQGTGAPTGDVAIGEVGDPLEHDADAAAAVAVAQLHGLGERPDEPRSAPSAGHGVRLQRCHTPPPPTKQPEPPRKDPIYDTYAAAIAKLKQSAPETYELISALPLEVQGAFRTIRTVPWNLGAPAGVLTHNFQLRMELVDAIPGEASTLAKFIGPGGSKSAASPELAIATNISKPPLFIRYPMRILVTRAAASDTDRLEANLFHESIHMFRYMDRQLAERRADLGYPADAKEASPFQAPFERYEAAARGTTEFDALKKLFATANAGSSTPGDADLAAADAEIVTNFLDEKFAYDSTVKRYGAKYGLSNAEIGSMYLDDLIQDRGWNVRAEDKGKMRKAIIDLLDAVDKALAPPP